MTKVASLAFPIMVLYFMVNNFRAFVNMTWDASMEDGDTNCAEFSRYFIMVLMYHPLDQWDMLNHTWEVLTLGYYGSMLYCWHMPFFSFYLRLGLYLGIN